MNLSGDEGRRHPNVSRETLDRLNCFEALVQKWNPRINLVSRKSLDDLWPRHIIDSIQVFRSTDKAGHWVDLGSGGGFPGIVIAILAAEERPEVGVTLVESDQRKCAFLRTAIRETGVKCRVLAKRIELVEPQNADVLSARALTNLPGLLEFAERHLSTDGLALFPKGVTWQKEVAEARRAWRFNVESVDSSTEAGAVILKVKGISRD
ncbi:16S rRNA (guanine(527)-N(7))-methyltransferase RsmG [Sedimentitalea todarodis]|uniref:Ribosomal RNA small subunit methyltransferase G n=1 Tax=Sedimentitalea todarodis TaxID=1631240 RepID=A0ABU3VIY2_9RHOB|nr:16S rRNA (guanine(527)-N(7))-methyltransferase RsmG [Sedimentitalea todarodis]MDU9006058.1 16S rRNA (guanine(527)-N(7))-methyltransferase RsmG [Sedimentitalea todarodis]